MRLSIVSRLDCTKSDESASASIGSGTFRPAQRAPVRWGPLSADPPDAERHEEDLADPGLSVLEMLLRLRGVDVDAEQLRSRIGHRKVGIAEMLDCAEAFGLSPLSLAVKWDDLGSVSLPGIAALRNGSFLLLGKTAGEKSVVVAPGAGQPTFMTREEFEDQWDGRLVLMKKPSALGRLLKRLRAISLALTVHKWSQRIKRLHPLSRRKANKFGIAPVRLSIASLAARARDTCLSFELQKITGHRHTDELAFLPAALEIVETPPSPTGRAIAYSIMAVFGAALIWACIGSIDIVAVASGKIIPSGRTKIVQPFETGVVRAIHVSDGQRVSAGAVLVELDPTMSDAELGHLKSDLLATQLEAARLRAALEAKDDPLAAFKAPADTPHELLQMNRRFLVSQIAEQNAKLAAIDRQMAQKEAERATIQAAIEKLEATATPLQERVGIREQLFNKELGSKLHYLSELQDLVGQRKEILVQQSRHGETTAAIAALMETRSKTVAEYERALYDDLAKAEQKMAGLSHDVIKAGQRTSLQRLTAPVDGVVQQLAIHTVGGVVTPAQTLMLIVPVESRLEIEALISNRDIGFVEVGQDAAIKVDAFNFTRYGLLHGKILSVSQDAITRNLPDKAIDKSLGAETSSSEPKGQELIYSAGVSLDRSQMNIEGKRVNLSPGMAVTVEVKTGSRRLISYLLSPLVRYKHDSLRER